MIPLDHDTLREDVGAYVLGALPPAEKVRVGAHVAVCPECAAEVNSLRGAADSLAWSVDPVEPPPGTRERVLAAAVGTTGVRRAAPVRVAVLPWLAAAASLAFAVGLGIYSAGLRGRIQGLEEQLRAAVLQVQASEQQNAQMRLVAASAQRQLAVLAAPDVAHVDLKGLAAAPQASARALWSRSRGLLLSASNLPSAPAGRTYQLWVISGRMPPISDGWLFKPDASGSVTSLFVTPAAMPMPTTIAVTLEPDGGTRAPTGAMYLAGSLN
jgi:anti-sigma-K factor RskA